MPPALIITGVHVDAEAFAASELEGMAHGFCVLSESADFVYKCTDTYAPEFEQTILWSDPALAIQWPGKEPLISGKDAKGVLLKDAKVLPQS